jgi:hypothetical protein
MTGAQWILGALLLCAACTQPEIVDAPPSPARERSKDAGEPAENQAKAAATTTDAGSKPEAEARAADGGQKSAPAKPRPAASDTDAGEDTQPMAADAGHEPMLPPPSTSAEILTQRYDNARTGANLNERSLGPKNVEQLRLLGSWLVDGELYAQVLVAADVEIAGKRKAVAIVATMSDSLYAFDADAPPDSALLWQQGMQQELGKPGFCARNVGGPNGILSTPVIDKARGHVYVVARDCDPSFPVLMPRCQHRLVQLKLETGEILRSITVAGEVLVADAAGVTSTRFEPSAHWNRPGLLLAGNKLVIAFGSGPAGDQHEEDFVYHGWVFRYDVSKLEAAPDVYCTTPRGRGGSVWQAGAAPAADDQAIFVTGANGIQDDGLVHPPPEWPLMPKGQEDSVVRLPHDQAFPTPQDTVQQFWDMRPYIGAGTIFQHMESGDNGFGSSGPLLIPDTRLLLVGTKAGLTYLLNRDSMQPAQEPLSPFTDLALQPGHSLYLHSWWGIPMTTQTFVFWRPNTAQAGRRYGYAYAWANNDRLRQLRFDYEASSLQLTATAEVPEALGGGNLVLSAAGDAQESGVLWATSRLGTGTSGAAGTLWSFDPLTLKALWQTPLPAWSKFNPPTVVRGRVFVPSSAPDPALMPQVLVYGLPSQ